MRRLTRRDCLGVLILVVVALLLLAGLAWGAFQPWTANHFSYALPGQDRLPYRISYAGRDYSNAHECAGADWCRPDSSRCLSWQQVVDQSIGPVAQVGSVPTLFGSSHPIFAPSTGGLTVMGIYVLERAKCYLIYTIEGGP